MELLPKCCSMLFVANFWPTWVACKYHDWMSCICSMSQVVTCHDVIKNVLPSTLLGDKFCCLFLLHVMLWCNKKACWHDATSIMLSTCHKMSHVIDIVTVELATVTHNNSNQECWQSHQWVYSQLNFEKQYRVGFNQVHENCWLIAVLGS